MQHHAPAILPATTHTPLPPLTAEPQAFIPAARPLLNTTPPSNQPPALPVVQNDQPIPVSTAQAVTELTQHLQYAYVELVEQCAESLKALTIFEEAYVKKEGWAVGALTPTERFRVAMGRILDVCEGHVAMLEAQGQL